MAIKKHVFISTSGELLPRWKEAFPKAVTGSPDRLPKIDRADFVWLRINQMTSASEQIAAVSTFTADAPLIILADMPNDDEAMETFRKSARGYANAHSAPDTLKQITKVIENGGLWIGESLMRRLLLGVDKLPQTSPKAELAGSANPFKLTDREMEVAKAIAGGASNKEVARILHITERTVKAHVSGLFTKLGVTDRLQLALKMRALS